jgi:hypothetical protein
MEPCLRVMVRNIRVRRVISAKQEVFGTVYDRMGNALYHICPFLKKQKPPQTSCGRGDKLYKHQPTSFSCGPYACVGRNPFVTLSPSNVIQSGLWYAYHLANALEIGIVESFEAKLKLQRGLY